MSRSASSRRTAAPKTSIVNGSSRAEATAKAVDPSVSGQRKEGYRDTVEAIVGAILLAILVRGLEAEAFVIPTGSMAPTLMGRHKEIACPQCGFVYAVNAADEVEGGRSGSSGAFRVASGICLNCRFQADLSQTPSFKGDRILVDKAVYDLPGLPGGGGPKRWDVIVFRFPEEPEVSYIKRLVGLPGESVRIWYGDAYIKTPSAKGFEIARKPLEHQSAMQVMVYDDHLRAAVLKDKPEWQRWSSLSGSNWSEDATNPGVYRSSADPSKWTELAYEHKVPDPGQWLAITANEPLPRPARPTLITDFSSYNTNLSATNTDLNGEVGYEQESAWFQPHWVGDLTLSSRFRFSEAKGSVRYSLVEGGVFNTLEFDLATGKATVKHGKTTLGELAASIESNKENQVEFANVDNRLTILVNGTPLFGDGLAYDDPENAHPLPAPEDLRPARVATLGADVVVSDLVLKRDIYYTVKPGTSDYTYSWETGLPRTPVELFDLMADPVKVASHGALKPGETYVLGEDRFMMFGDNSPRSRDSRDWRETDRYDPNNPEHGWDTSDRKSWEVPRHLITGKAFAVFWPHGKPFGPDIRLSPDFRIPFRPYIERMKWIR